MSKPIRIAIVGTGFMAKTQGLNLAAQQDVQIVAVCGLNLQLARTFIADHGFEQATAFDCFDAMLDSVSLDAVYFALPPFAHNDQLVTALNRGLHVFTEKPLALNLEDANAMADAATRSGKVTQVDYQFRFKPSVKRLVQAINDGTAGRPTLFTGRFWVNMDGADWWRNKAQSRGQIFEQVIHLYNLAVALCGDVESVTGQMRNLCHRDHDDYSIEDTSIGTLNFTNGAMASITGSNCAVKDHFFGDFRVAFENVTLDCHTTGQSWVTPDHAYWYADGKCERLDESVGIHREVARDFIAAIRENRPALCPIQQAYEDVKLIFAIIESAENDGKRINMETCHAYSG